MFMLGSSLFLRYFGLVRSMDALQIIIILRYREVRA